MGLKEIVLSAMIGLGCGYSGAQYVPPASFPESTIAQSQTGIPVRIEDAYKNSYCIRKAAYATFMGGKKVVGNFSHATAFIIQSSKDGTYVATNAHVILSKVPVLPEGATIDDIVFSLVDNIVDSKIDDDVPLRVVAIDKEKDIAILKLEGKRQFYSTQHGTPTIAQESFFVGYLRGLLKVYEKGVVSGEVFLPNENKRLYVTNHDMMPGCSGAPVYVFNNKSSTLIGIATMGFGETYSLITPIEYVDELLKRLNKCPVDERKNLEGTLEAEAPLLINDTIKSNEFINSHKDYRPLEK